MPPDSGTRASAETPASGSQDEGARLRSFLLAIARHGQTMWPDTSMGGGGIGGQMITSEQHGEVVDHLVSCALRGDSLKQAADDWARLFPGTPRLDGPAGRSGRRGPDGRPR